MRPFAWLSAEPIPFEVDLRRRGWVLTAVEAPFEGWCPALLHASAIASHCPPAPARAATILLGIDDGQRRAQALAHGFGEVLCAEVTLAELEQRAHRVARALEMVPRRRRTGTLELDLLLRDGLVGGKRLGLHPREFGLLWRLAQNPGEAVTPQDLLAEVWRMNFRPETNSLAVHVCRLRAKLASAGLAGVVNTTPEGYYALTDAAAPALPLRREGRPLDGHLRPPADQPAALREKN